MKKFFSEKQIYVATFFGGPIPSGILLYKNFKQLGDDKKAIWSLILTFIFTIALIYGIVKIPEEILDRIPNIAFTVLYTGVVYLIYNKYFARNINTQITDSNNKVSNWSVFGITVIGLIINVAILFTIAFSEPVFPGEKFEYGAVKHEIFYDEGEISNNNLNIIGNVLTEYEYFTDDIVTSVRVNKESDIYSLTINVQKEFWSDNEVIEWLLSLKSTLISETGKKFKLVLISYDLSEDSIKEI
ncbi:MAG: hypothetical protein N4A72_17000 [Bacteroidales bacterium]|jgi:hypothetical protein|nr:hypothetical protein [Bacteroidales bacterium]